MPGEVTSFPMRQHFFIGREYSPDARFPQIVEAAPDEVTNYVRIVGCGIPTSKRILRIGLSRHDYSAQATPMIFRMTMQFIVDASHVQRIE